MLRPLVCYRKALFCWCVLAACGGSLLAGERVQPEYLPQLPVNQQRIMELLSEPTEFEAIDLPLNDALSFLREQHQINVWIDEAALAEERINPEVSVDLTVKGISLRSTLRLLLSPVSLTYVVGDEALIITTYSRANQMMSTRIYPVADLAKTPEELDEILTAVELVLRKPYEENQDRIRLNLAAVPLAKSLVIRQTYDGHEEILKLLRNLREAKTLADKAGETRKPDATPAAVDLQ